MRYTLRAALLCLACAAPALASMSATAQESHVNTARDLAANCANCHGTDGHAIAGMSSLAARPRDALLERLLAFKSGARTGTLMPQLARGYSDAQLAAIASYFASQPAVAPRP